MRAVAEREPLGVGQQRQHTLPRSCRVEQQEASDTELRCSITLLLRGEDLNGDAVTVVNNRRKALDDPVADPLFERRREVAKCPPLQPSSLD